MSIGKIVHKVNLHVGWGENYYPKYLNIDINEVAQAVTADARISKYGTMKFGEPFDGKCLPKDMNHLITSFYARGLKPGLFDAIKTFNDQLLNQRHNHMKE